MSITTSDGHVLSTKHIAGVLLRAGKAEENISDSFRIVEVYLVGGQTMLMRLPTGEAETARNAIVAAIEAEEG